MINFDLEKRTTEFSKKVVTFLQTIPQNKINDALINQLVRSATSIGANYREANGASSKKDLRNKIHICKKEAQETKYWLEILGGSDQVATDGYKELLQESHQLTLIFGKICSTLAKTQS